MNDSVTEEHIRVYGLQQTTACLMDGWIAQEGQNKAGSITAKGRPKAEVGVNTEMFFGKERESVLHHVSNEGKEKSRTKGSGGPVQLVVIAVVIT